MKHVDAVNEAEIYIYADLEASNHACNSRKSGAVFEFFRPEICEASFFHTCVNNEFESPWEIPVKLTSWSSCFIFRIDCTKQRFALCTFAF